MIGEILMCIFRRRGRRKAEVDMERFRGMLDVELSIVLPEP